ncbi:carbohydrate binding family 9 domain-containing protein [Shewanella sp. MEBiC00475]|uniref:carbohydrate binding family 9 domain-containing protein n=1 Tax=Shewanella sp. MEBiC00475 TaxID=2575361 RepID=UPI001585E2A3|nr:carbohydrate binding family 9 domain-containing protein [Shewanella sp. MEBiC00475]
MKYYFLPARVFCLILSLVSGIVSLSVFAGSSQQFHLDIPTINEDIEVDGEFNEPAWQQAAQVMLKYETSPGENIAAPVTTYAKVYASKTSLYFAFIAHDPSPDKIRVNLRDRDKSWGDDMVGIKLDTFNNARLAYQFFINPYGVQSDSIENELTGQESDAWDGIWYSKGKLTDQGYQVEIQLPLRLFNFDDRNPLQTWGIELIRFYPRNETHRISTHQIDRNVSCQLCQLGTASGLAGATQGKDLQLTPSLVADQSSQRDVAPTQPWSDENNVEVGLDLRWGITPTTLLNATINPDFSQVEADAGQLDVNNTFALFFPEKRAFFLDNKDYFDTQLDLLHTRNIGSPDYGLKLTSKTDDHTFAILAANDTQSQFLVPGNLSSDIAVIDEQSHNVATRYRFDPSKQFSIGGLVTLKQADEYHNYLASADIKYQPTKHDTFTAQYAHSQTAYPDDLFNQFCGRDDCSNDIDVCYIGNCAVNERVLRTNKDGEFSGRMFNLSYKHERRNWYASTNYESIGSDFRADLGFIDKVDINKFVAGGGYIWYPENNFFNKIDLGGDWDITHNQNNERLEQETEMYIEFNGGLQSFIGAGIVQRERVGRRHNPSIIDIDDNTSIFNQTLGWFYTSFTPIGSLKLELDSSYGDDIDFANDRPATTTMLNPGIEWKLTESLVLDISHRYQTLDVDDGRLFTANLSDMRLNWQLSLNSFIRLSSVYTRIERDPDLYKYQQPDKLYQDIGNELLYGYKLNPQSVFYLGYSDAFIANDDIDSLTQNEKTYFMKLSYAWLL